MKNFTAGEISAIVNGRIISGSPKLTVKQGVYYTQLIKEKNTLIFLRFARNIDWELIFSNLPCVIVTEKKLEQLEPVMDCTVILVPDIDNAMWLFIERYRGLFSIPVVTVTGTCGKTTTKDMIIHMLSKRLAVVGTKKSNNSRTHNFSYLLEIDENTEAAVFETPVGVPGDIINSCKYYQPTIGIITNIGIDHIEGCKTLENYIRAKGEMLTCIGDKGLLIINADDNNIRSLPLEDFHGSIVRFGCCQGADLKASEIEYSTNSMSFILEYKNQSHKVYVPGYGEHQVYNALAALAAVINIGLDIHAAIESLKLFENLPHHNQLLPGINNSLIIDDIWSTNINSLTAALKVLINVAKGRKRFALIGDINTLGDYSLEIHHQAGRLIAETEAVDVLITVGPLSAEMVNKSVEFGFKGKAFQFPSVDGVLELLKQSLDSNSILLIKSAGDQDMAMLNLSYDLRMY